MIQKESLSSSFVLDPDDGSFTQIPWYLTNTSHFNQSFNSVRNHKLSLKMSSQVEPEDFYEREQRRKVLDANRYATKKTIAQGMLDVALLTANASQLKYVLQVGEDNHPFYHLMLALIILSIILQIIVGILFLIIGPLDVDESKNQKLLMILNHTALAFSFGSMFTDTIKFVFVADTNRGFPTSKINTELDL